MMTFVALLRAVNVGGRGTLPMARLRDLAAGLRFEAPQTVLQSGNLVFRARASAKPVALEHLLETALTSRLDLHANVCVRTAVEWRRIVERNPFPEEAESDPGHLLMMALKRPAGAVAVDALRASIAGRELVRGDGAHLYLYYPDGIGRSRLTAAVIERAVGARGTARNWSTVLKLDALCATFAEGRSQ
jgi:uncharacterized protein (DUF1697 family)